MSRGGAGAVMGAVMGAVFGAPDPVRAGAPPHGTPRKADASGSRRRAGIAAAHRSAAGDGACISAPMDRPAGSSLKGPARGRPHGPGRRAAPGARRPGHAAGAGALGVIMPSAAPSGSVSMAMRPTCGMSKIGRESRPPARSIAAAAASTSSTAK